MHIFASPAGMENWTKLVRSGDCIDLNGVKVFRCVLFALALLLLQLGKLMENRNWILSSLKSVWSGSRWGRSTANAMGGERDCDSRGGARDGPFNIELPCGIFFFCSLSFSILYKRRAADGEFRVHVKQQTKKESRDECLQFEVNKTAFFCLFTVISFHIFHFKYLKLENLHAIIFYSERTSWVFRLSAAFECLFKWCNICRDCFCTNSVIYLFFQFFCFSFCSNGVSFWINQNRALVDIYLREFDTNYINRCTGETRLSLIWILTRQFNVLFKWKIPLLLSFHVPETPIYSEKLWFNFSKYQIESEKISTLFFSALWWYNISQELLFMTQRRATPTTPPPE